MALLLAQGAAFAQETVRSVVVSADSAGRLRPEGSSGASPGAKRYWADTSTNSIRRSNLDGSAVEDVVTGLSGPYGLSFDAAAGAFLWTSSGEETVQRLDAGSGRPTNLQTEFEDPFAIILEQEGVKVAYAVLEGAVVKVTVTRTGETETEEQEVLMQFDPATQAVHGLALDQSAGALYVGNFDGMMTHRVRLADKQVETLSFVDEPFAQTGLTKGAQ